jgi:hypothetical protein
MTVLAAQSNPVPHSIQANSLPDAQLSLPMVAKLVSDVPKPPVSFKPAVTYASNEFAPGAVAVGDVNGDGKTDLILASCSQHVFCGTPGGGKRAPG